MNKIESINRVFQFLILSIFVYSNSVLAEGYWGLRNINAQLPDSLYQSFGASKYAFSISWARTERQDDEYTWDMLDNMLDFIQRNNGEGVLLFQVQSGWATGGESRAPNDLDRDTPLGDEVPENGYSELLYDFAYQVAIHIYEYEGEPEVRYFRYGPEPQYEWETTPDTYEQDIEDYVRCLRTFYLAIHAAGEDDDREVLVSHGGFYYISQLEREWFRLGEANEDVQDSLLTLLQSRNERHAFRYRQWEDLVRRMNPRDGIPPTYWMDVMAGQTDFLDWFDVHYHWKPRFIWDELGAFEHVVQDSGGELKPWLAAEAAMQLAEGSLTEYEERFHAADMARKWVLGMAFGLKGICTLIVGFPPDRFFGLFNPRGDEYMSADVYRNPIMRDFFLKYHDDMDWYNYFEDASHNSVTILRYLYGWHDLENVYMDVVWYDALFDSDQDTVDYLPIEPDDFEHFQVFDMFGEALTDELNEVNSTIPLTQEPIFIRWFQPASVDQDKLSAPTNFIIQSLYPNPFNSEVKLQFSLKYPSPINVRLVNLNGRVMWQDDMELQREGDHSLSISAGELPSRVYFVRVGNEREVLNRKVVLLR